jgi:hypothetical protein
MMILETASRAANCVAVRARPKASIRSARAIGRPWRAISDALLSPNLRSLLIIIIKEIKEVLVGVDVRFFFTLPLFYVVRVCKPMRRAARSNVFRNSDPISPLA